MSVETTTSFSYSCGSLGLTQTATFILSPSPLSDSTDDLSYNVDSANTTVFLLGL
jgi:hypothetical protein